MKQDLEKIAIAVRCNSYKCKFNGIILIPRGKSKEKSLQQEECPACHADGSLQLISY